MRGAKVNSTVRREVKIVRLLNRYRRGTLARERGQRGTKLTGQGRLVGPYWKSDRKEGTPASSDTGGELESIQPIRTECRRHDFKIHMEVVRQLVHNSPRRQALTISSEDLFLRHGGVGENL